MAEADFTTTESTRKQVPCGPGERSRQSHMGQGLPPICIPPAIRFIANTPLATRAGVVLFVAVRAIPSKKSHAFVRAASAAQVSRIAAKDSATVENQFATVLHLHWGMSLVN
jgi:hypothetical protein